MKKILLTIMTLSLLVCVISCENDTNNESDLPPYDMINDILLKYADIFPESELIYSEAEDEMDRLDNAISGRYIGNGSEYVNLEMFESYCIATSNTSSATEVGILKIKEGEDVNYIKELIESHFIYVSGLFSSYNEKEANLAKNGEVKIKGNYLYYIISEKNHEILSDIERYFSEISN